MRTNITTIHPQAATQTESRPRRERRGRAFYETARYLDTLKVGPEQSNILADLLTLWVRHTLKIDPSAAAHVFRAIGDALADARADARASGAGVDPDATDTCFRGAFYDRLREMRGEEACDPSQYDRERAANLANAMLELLDSMRRRVTVTAAVEGEGLKPEAAAPTQVRPRVVAISSWRERAG